MLYSAMVLINLELVKPMLNAVAITPNFKIVEVYLILHFPNIQKV